MTGTNIVDDVREGSISALRILPFDELDRHHAQARICLEDAMVRNDPIAYRRAERLEQNVRMEKIHRAMDRERGIPERKRVVPAES